MTERDNYLRRKYGITEKHYVQLLQRQNGCCGICKRPAKVFRTRLAVDHNHRTKEIRGLLCIFCNRFVVGRHTDPNVFLSAYEYLSKGTGLFVPDRKRKTKKRKKKGTKKK